MLETVRAGQRAAQSLAPRTAIRIMTGAPLPDGANTVIRVEDTDGGEKWVTIRDARDAGRNVRPRGEDLRAGALALPRGTLIGAAQLGVLASVGCALVPAYRTGFQLGFALARVKPLRPWPVHHGPDLQAEAKSQSPNSLAISENKTIVRVIIITAIAATLNQALRTKLIQPLRIIRRIVLSQRPNLSQFVMLYYTPH